MPQKNRIGFTLIELLITVSILGLIAAFGIPKIISAQRDERYNSNAKEVISTLSQAFEQYTKQNGVSTNLSYNDLTPYINYVQNDTTASLDDVYGGGTISCGPICLRLHNGGLLRPQYCSLGGTTTTHALTFYFDPDGVNGGTTNGPGKSLHIFIYADGRVSTRGTTSTNTDNSCAANWPPCPACDPPWFHW